MQARYMLKNYQKALSTFRFKTETWLFGKSFEYLAYTQHSEEIVFFSPL